jgi:uncharacterized membrane protein
MTLSFLVFTFGLLLVAIQIAGGQLTPRIIATTLLRDNVVRYAVGLFVFSMMFAISALNRLETHVHQLVLLLAGALAVMSMASFLYLIDYAARLLRPISILGRVAERGFEVIEHLYPRPARPSDLGRCQQTWAQRAESLPMPALHKCSSPSICNRSSRRRAQPMAPLS